MKKIIVILSLMHFFCSSLIAAEAFFRPIDRKNIDLIEGDSFQGVIEVWNLRNLSVEMINNMKGQSFLDSFYVVSVKEPRWSANNPSVAIIEGDFILEKVISQNEKKWKLGGLLIPVTIKEINTTVLDKKEKEIVVFEHRNDVNNKNHFKYISLVILTFFLGLFFFLKKKKKPVEKVKEINWKHKINTAESIDDISYLYVNRKVWEQGYLERKKEIKDFVKTSEKYLFRKKVEPNEVDELKLKLKSISKENSQ